MRLCLHLGLLAMLTFVDQTFALAEGTTTVKRESFDRDPNWEGLNNHATPKRVPTVIQKFGYSTSNIAGKVKGEIGGQVWRSSTRASYAGSIVPKTLKEKLT